MKTKKNIFYSITALVTAGSLSVAVTGTASAANLTAANGTVAAVQSDHMSFDELVTSNDEAAALYSLLTYYEQIPDEVLEQGDEALRDWREKNPVYPERASVLGCVGAITWLIGSNVVGAVKIIKIKKYIKALGGVKDAVQLMWGGKFQL